MSAVQPGVLQARHAARTHEAALQGPVSGIVEHSVSGAASLARHHNNSLTVYCLFPRCSSLVECLLMVQWLVRSIPHAAYGAVGRQIDPSWWIH